jgi:hypothetical protein
MDLAAAAGAQLDETIAGPELINDNEIPLPSTFGLGTEDIKGAINLDAYEVKKVGAQKILAPAESDNVPRVSLSDTEVGVAGTDDSTPPSRNDTSNPQTTIGNNTSGVQSRSGGGGTSSTPLPPDLLIGAPQRFAKSSTTVLHFRAASRETYHPQRSRPCPATESSHPFCLALLGRLPAPSC